MENIKEIATHLETLVQKGLEDKASKEDVAAIQKNLLNLKGTLAAMGEDSERETKKFSKALWTKKMSSQWSSEVYQSFDRENLWRKANDPEGLKKAYLAKATNVNEYDSTSAQYMLPTAVDSVIHALVPIYGVARRSARVITGVRGSLNLNARNAAPSFARTVNSTVRDDATVTPNSPTYTHVTIQPAQSSGIAKVTNKLIYDAVPGVLEDAGEQLAIAAGVAEDTELFLGDGSATYNSFTGLKTASIGYNGTVAARTNSFTSFDPLLQCQQFVYPSVVRSGNCKYHMTPQTFALLQSFKASTSGLYFFDLSTNSWKVAGCEIEFNQVMDSPDSNGTTFAIGKVPVIYGDLNKAVTLAIGRDTNLKTLVELYAATNETGLQLTYDFAFGIVLSSAVTRISIVS